LASVDRRRLLESVPIFSSLGEPEIDALLAATTTRRLAAKELLFRKGDPGHQLYGVLSGRLKVVSTGRDGRELVFGVMAPGDVIGEIALMDSNPRSATVVALETSELLVLHRRDLLPYLERHPQVAIHLAAVLAARVRRLSDHAEDAIFLPLPARMAKTVLALAQRHGAGGGALAEIRLSQQDLADMVGTTRESVNKQLRTWSAEGLVELRRARLRILDREALEDVADFSGV